MLFASAPGQWLEAVDIVDYEGTMCGHHTQTGVQTLKDFFVHSGYAFLDLGSKYMNSLSLLIICDKYVNTVIIYFPHARNQDQFVASPIHQREDVLSSSI